MTTRVLAALLLVLTVATSASAECAWVLWDWDHLPIAGGVTRDKVWIVVSGHQNLTDCTAERVKLVDALTYANKLLNEQRGSKDRAPYSPAVVCLPDTIDPRGPKGSGR